MTIKELCNNETGCKKCPFLNACTLLDCNPPFGFDGDDDKNITQSIIETASMLESTLREREIRENLNRLTIYRVSNSYTDLVSLNAVKRVLNLAFRGNRDSEVCSND